MALERRRPLPAGRYWLDIVPGNRAQWEIWSNAMKGVDSVKFEHAEHFDAVTGIPGLVPSSPERDFVIFSLSTPNVAWEASGLPSPTIAPSEITSAADTAELPPPEPSALEQLEQAASGVGTSVKVGLGVGVGVGVLALLVAMFRR